MLYSRRMLLHALPGGLRLFVAGTQRIVDQKENKDGAEAAATEFFGAIARYQCPEEFVHMSEFMRYSMNKSCQWCASLSVAWESARV